MDAPARDGINVPKWSFDGAIDHSHEGILDGSRQGIGNTMHPVCSFGAPPSRSTATAVARNCARPLREAQGTSVAPVMRMLMCGTL